MGNPPQHSEQVSPPSIVCLHFWAWRLRINISPEGQKSEIVILKLNSEIQLREVMILLLACILKLQFSIACTLYTLSTTFGKGFPSWALSHTFMFVVFLLNIKVALCIHPLKTNISIEEWWLEDSLHFPLNMGPLKKKNIRKTGDPFEVRACSVSNRSKADGGNPSHGGLPGHQLALRYQHLATVWVTYICSQPGSQMWSPPPIAVEKQTADWLADWLVVEGAWTYRKQIADLNIFHGDHWN